MRIFNWLWILEKYWKFTLRYEITGDVEALLLMAHIRNNIQKALNLCILQHNPLSSKIRHYQPMSITKQLDNSLTLYQYLLIYKFTRLTILSQKSVIKLHIRILSLIQFICLINQIDFLLYSIMIQCLTIGISFIYLLLIIN